jgi:hypothetical protein
VFGWIGTWRSELAGAGGVQVGDEVRGDVDELPAVPAASGLDGVRAVLVQGVRLVHPDLPILESFCDHCVYILAIFYHFPRFLIIFINYSIFLAIFDSFW